MEIVEMNKKNTASLDLMALSFVDGLGAITIKKLAERYAGTGEIFSVSREELREISDAPLDVLAKIRDSRDFAEYKQELEFIENEGISVTCLKDDDYPESLRDIYDPPPVIYYKGELPGKKDICVAVVGSRKCSLYGLRVAGDLSGEIAASGVTVVSGMASGIDTAAHRGALKSRGRTVAVMGTGFKHLYPEGSEKMVAEICRSGAVITEFPSSTRSSKFTFPRRNRIISGMSRGVVVVEAAKRSGALITVDFALEQGKDVFAVPGPVDSLTSSGTNALIQNGAKLVVSANDILDEILPYGWKQDPGSGKAISEGDGRRENINSRGIPEKDLTLDQAETLKVLSEGIRHIDEIVSSTGIDHGKIHGILVSLELLGMVRALPGGKYECSGEGI